MFENVRLAFATVLKNLRKPSDSGRKSSENHQKRRRQYVYIEDITRWREDMNFMFEWQERCAHS